MNTDDLTISELFYKAVVYKVPVYQRLYVWEEDVQLEPLWNDMKRMALSFEMGDTPPVHFLGASVQQVAALPAGEIHTRLVIDGQQRLTTLQILLKAFKDVIKNTDKVHYDKIEELIKNKDEKDEKLFKILPTVTDKKHFHNVINCEDKSSLLEKYGYRPDVESTSDNILSAYLFFHNSIASWLDELPEAKQGKRIESLYEAITENARLVVIDIDEREDDAQLIFEKLNTGGEPLLAADLVKNSLLLEIEKDDEDVETAYQNHWENFEIEKDFWRAKIGTQIKKVRIEIYLRYVLAILTGDDVPASDLYRSYNEHVKKDDSGTTALSRMQTLQKFGNIYRKIEENQYKNPRVNLFLYRFHAMNSGTVYPFLLKLFDKLGNDENSLVPVLEDLESFLMRRMICGLTNKNYNLFFVDILKTLDVAPEKIHLSVRGKLQELTSETHKWPSDEEFKKGWMETKKFSAANAKLILEALEKQIRSKFSEDDVSTTLTVEHILPQKWQSIWDLPEGKNPTEAMLYRNDMLGTIGNLTLTNKKLNASLSNKVWIVPDDPKDGKRAALNEHSNLHLNKILCTNYPHKWDEETIKERSESLFEKALEIWPRPE